MNENEKLRLGVIGLGTIGGSLAMAARSRGAASHVVGVDSDARICELALAAGAVDSASTNLSSAIQDCDVVALCVPVGVMREVMAMLSANVAPHAVLTDVAGVKQVVQNWAQELVPNMPFVGGHPMAGAQGGGFNAARADLFEGASVALCGATDNSEALERVAGLWRNTGAVCRTMTASEHDAHVARTSHLPYLSVLAQLHGMKADDVSLLGPGFDNATRYAEYAPAIMAAAATANASLPAATRALAHELLKIADTLENKPNALLEYAEKAKQKREDLLS